MLRCLAGLEKVDGGKIFLDNRDITYALPKERNLSMIFQQYSLFPTMTVAKNVAFGLKMQKLDRAEIKSRVATALKMVDLVGSENKYPGQLSGGEQQRVALARSIIRYTVLVNWNLIDVDTLFEVNNQFARNDEVYLSIDKELIIYFDSAKKIS